MFEIKEYTELCKQLSEAQEKVDQFLITDNMQCPLLDDDGYPTDAALQIIKLWTWRDKKGWFDFIKSIWWHQDWGWGETKLECSLYGEIIQYEISTGGWSGNESVIQAMQENKNSLWSFTWYSSRRGGHYTFRRNLNE